MKTESKVIDGIEYKVSQLGAQVGQEALLRLVKCGAAGFGALFEQGASPASFAYAIDRLSLTSADLAYFTKLFAEKTFVVLEDGKMPRLDLAYDMHFAGKYWALAQWLKFAMEVNFTDFFLGALGAFQAPKGVSAQPSPVSS